MKIYSVSHIGSFHTNYNEDYQIVADIGSDRKLIAVMDGCSSGIDSYFISTFIGNVLRKISKELGYQEFVSSTKVDLDILLRKVTQELFRHVSDINRQLDLRSDELLSTLLLGIVDASNLKVELIIVGDGVIQVDGELEEFENDNKPDYLGYHLNMNFDLWYQTKAIKRSFKNVRDLSISTDGIFTFKKIGLDIFDEVGQDKIQDLFFVDRSDLENENKLVKTLYHLKKNYDLAPTDDFTIIRVLID